MELWHVGFIFLTLVLLFVAIFTKRIYLLIPAILFEGVATYVSSTVEDPALCIVLPAIFGFLILGTIIYTIAQGEI